MTFYPDRRQNYRGVAQWDVPAGGVKGDIVGIQREATAIIAMREAAPRDNFRVTTADVNVADTESKPPVTANPQPQLPEQPTETKFSLPTQ